ncbi:MAG: DAK2 domain-containing protein [Chloroflexi bacterium]|nr:DAK2 domain-containing protein [Chloroflexota bacterium]
MASERHCLECDGRLLAELLVASTAWLEQHTTEINLLNVYPVPDGDTGTNMCLTMQAATAEVAQCPDLSAAGVAHAASHGALMGARGNSGVILSQILRGFARSLDKQATFTAADLARALQEASATAYKGVIKPVEGTMLTVIRESAEAATVATRETDDLLAVLERVLPAARESVERTPSLLPVLRQAGVVDAGGQGLYRIMEGVVRYLHGETLEAAREAAAVAALTPPEQGYGYDVQYVIQGSDLDVEAMRARIAEMGESALVVGDRHNVKVHVHVSDPGEILSYGARQGALSKITVEDMQEQYRQFLAAQASAAESLWAGGRPSDTSTVVVASGEGLMKVFESLGATAVVPGGQTMNPSTQEILQAIERVNGSKVIVLPNNANIVLAAQQAVGLSKKQAVVVPTKTVPQGIAALLALNADADLGVNCQAMTRAANAVQTAEITTAVRAALVNGLNIQNGSYIGLVNGELAATGQDVLQVIQEALKKIETQEKELITIYYGNGVEPLQARQMADLIRESYPGQAVELVQGGQPHYDYIISAE